MPRRLLLAALAALLATSSTAQQIVDLRPGSTGSDPQGLAVVDGALYFSADDGSNGRSLWRSDGTPSGTFRVSSAFDGNTQQPPAFFTGFSGLVYFRAFTPGQGPGLWRTDGTPGGTTLAFSSAEAGGLGPVGLTVAGERLFYAATGGTGRQLWASDGTEVGTGPVSSLPAGASIDEITAVGPRVYFRAETSDLGAELYVSDGTPVGTRLVADVNPGPADGVFGRFRSTGSRLFFAAAAPGSGIELWVSDGPNDAREVANLSGTDDGFRFTSRPEETRPAALDGGHVVYAGRFVPGVGEEPTVSDGTPGGTEPLGNLGEGVFGSSPSWFASVGTFVVFTANDNANFNPDGTGQELWGTSGGEAVRLTDLNPGVGSGFAGFSNDPNYAEMDGRLYFRSSPLPPAPAGREVRLLSTDGRSVWTEAAFEDYVSSQDIVGEIAAGGGTVFFVRNAPDTGRELGLFRPAESSATETVAGPGVYPFPGTQFALVVSAGLAGGGGEDVTVRRYASAPAVSDGIEEAFVYPHRWVADTLAQGIPGLGAVRISVGELPGIPDPTDIVVYRRDAPGPLGGTFTALSTSYDGESGEIVASGVDRLGEFALASDTPPVSASPPPSGRRLSITASPNPMRGPATLVLALGSPGEVLVDAFDVLGRHVARLHEDPLPAGTHTLPFDASAWGPGVYLVRATSPTGTASAQVTVVR